MIRILLVDDDLAILELLGRILQAEHYEIIPTTNGKDGLVALESNTGKIDLILCDIMMEEMNGFNFLNVVKINPDWKNIPFIFLSAKNDVHSHYQGMQAGADDYLSKPVRREELLARINRFLNKN